MPPTKVLIQYTTDPVSQGLIREQLPAEMTVVFASGPGNLKEQIRGVDILYGHIDAAALAQADRLRWVQSHATGVETMLYPEFLARDIVLTNIKGVLATPIAEHVFALLLFLTRRMDQFHENRKVRQARIVPGWEIAGQTLVLIGLGHIGRAVAQRAKAFAMRVMAIDPVVSEAPPFVDQLAAPEAMCETLRAGSVVVACCPATPENFHMLGREQFAAMPAGSYFINVGRGAVVDEAALCDVLASGHLAGAGLDVTETEPYPPDGPLWNLPNVVLTAHSSAFTQHLGRRKIAFFLENLRRYAVGQPLLNVVDRQRGF